MSTTEELLFLIDASRQQHGRPNDKQWDELATIVKEHHAQQPFPFGSTVYTQNDFYEKNPIPCIVQNYTIGKDYVWVHCNVGEWGSQTFMPSHLFATPEEAESARKDQNAKSYYHPMP